MALGTVVLLASGFVMLRGDSSDGDSASDALGSPDAFVPYDDDAGSEPAVDEDDTASPGPGGTPEDFASTRNDSFGKYLGDTGPHKVRITVTSDGAIYVGYRFYKGSQGLKYANKSFSVSETVKGGRGVAQVGAQVLDTASYATCSISIDGVVVTTNRASKRFAVAVCTA